IRDPAIAGKVKFPVVFQIFHASSGCEVTDTYPSLKDCIHSFNVTVPVIHGNPDSFNHKSISPLSCLLIYTCTVHKTQKLPEDMSPLRVKSFTVQHIRRYSV